MAKGKFDGIPVALLPQRHKASTPVSEQPKVGRPKGKRSNPDYVRLTVLIPREIRKKAARKWEDENPDRDVSELVGMLLENWTHGRS